MAKKTLTEAGEEVKEQIIQDVLNDFNNSDYLMERAEELLDNAIDDALLKHRVDDEDGEIKDAIVLTVAADRREEK